MLSKLSTEFHNSCYSSYNICTSEVIPVTRKCTGIVIGVLILCLSYELIIIHYCAKPSFITCIYKYVHNIILRWCNYAVLQIEVFQFQIGSFFLAIVTNIKSTVSNCRQQSKAISRDSNSYL